MQDIRQSMIDKLRERARADAIKALSKGKVGSKSAEAIHKLKRQHLKESFGFKYGDIKGFKKNIK